MKYGSLQQDEVIIDFDEDLDIIAFPKDGETDSEGDIENQIKNIELPLVEKNNEIIHHEPQHNADVDEFNINYTHYNARSSNRNYKQLVMTICRNTELTVPQMVILFIMCIFLEYFVLLIITR